MDKRAWMFISANLTHVWIEGSAERATWQLMVGLQDKPKLEQRFHEAIFDTTKHMKRSARIEHYGERKLAQGLIHLRFAA